MFIQGKTALYQVGNYLACNSEIMGPAPAEKEQNRRKK